jgi:putative Holliday junction resolvase
MRILALDIGTKRIGVAKANTIISVATPTTTIHRTNIESDLNIIEKLIKENLIDKILLGLPLTLRGKEEYFAKYVREFGTILEERFKIEIIYWDERLSSVSAEKILTMGKVSKRTRKANVDRIAATIFLQNYLDYLKRNI